MIDNFGQCPPQIFEFPHPHRGKLDKSLFIHAPLISHNNYYCKRCCKFTGLYDMKIEREPAILYEGQLSPSPILYIGHYEGEGKIFTVNQNRSIALHTWRPNQKTGRMEFIPDSNSNRPNYSYLFFY